MNKNVILISLLTLLFASCVTNKNEFIYHVNSYTVDCGSVGPMKCLLIQKGETLNKESWRNFYSEIAGFKFEPGFTYKLLVKEEKLENPPADASNVKYSLVKILEKKQDPRFHISGSWEAFKIDDNIIKLKRARGAGAIPNIKLTINEMKISGTDGCNNLAGTILKIDKEDIVFSPLAGTRKMCLDMTIANKFNKAMLKVRKYKLEQDKLYFLDENSRTILEFNKTNLGAK